MSRLRASSQGPRRPPTGATQQLSLEEMRRRMLQRRNVDLHLNAADLEHPAEERTPHGHQALFVGRSLVITNSPQHPSATNDASDPHKLFQMLRKKKRVSGAPPAPVPERSAATPTAVPRHSPDRSQPHPAMDGDPEVAEDTHPPAPPPPPPPPSDVPPRPQGAGRPLGAATRYAHSAGAAPPSTKQGPRVREANSAAPHAHVTPDGRPATRQKLPSQSLDLFPEDGRRGSEKPRQPQVPDPFPRPAPRKGSATPQQQATPSQQQPAPSGGRRGVDFNCLFVSGDGDLGDNDEFPSPNARRADIPLIETEWFSASNTWEAVPLNPEGDDQAEPTVLSSEVEDTSQSLYELLVAHKGRRSAKRST